MSSAEQRLPDESRPEVLDIVEVGLSEAVPNGFQSENWRLDPTYRWQRVGRWNYDDALAVLDQPPTLWSNSSSSTVGTNDRVAERDLRHHQRSIGLIQPSAPVVVVSQNPFSGSKEVRLKFRHQRVEHELKITDPAYHGVFIARSLGHYPLVDGTLVTVSLAEPYAAPQQPGAEAYSYKIVAAIIEPGGAR